MKTGHMSSSGGEMELGNLKLGVGSRGRIRSGKEKSGKACGVCLGTERRGEAGEHL